MKNFYALFLFPLIFTCFSADVTAQVSTVDGTGRIVVVKKIPQRIVSLAPSATEILFALGAGLQTAARTDYCDYPAEAQKIPTVGGFDGKTFSFEKILSFRPDFVYAYTGMHNHLIAPLERYGIPVYMSDVKTVTDVLEEIRAIARLTGHEEAGKKLAQSIEDQITQITLQNTGATKKKVYWEVWNAPYMSAGNRSFIHDVIRISGGKNIFFDIEQAYPVVSEESIIARNPQVILLGDDSPVSSEAVSKRAGWQLIEAVKTGAVYKINADLVSRAGPRIVKAIQLLAELLQ